MSARYLVWAALVRAAVMTALLLAPLLAFVGAPALVWAEDAPSPDTKRVDTESRSAKEQAAELLAAFKDKDPSVKVRAIEAAEALQHASLVTPLVKLLGDKELGVRLAAIDALAKRSDQADRKKAGAGMAARLKRLSKGKADNEELLAVIKATGELGQVSGIKPLLDPIKLDMEMAEVNARISAAADIPHADTVEALIDFLALGRRGGRGSHRNAAHKALVTLTGANPKDHRSAGKDADRWRAWWKDNKKTFDFEALQQARQEAAAQKAEKAERKKKAREDRKKKQREKTKKKPSKPAPKKPPAID